MTGAASGPRVINTRAQHQADTLDALLRARGTVPVSYPCIEIAPPVDRARLDRALARYSAAGFAWLVFTSANAVNAFARACAERAIVPAALPGPRIAAVGTATANAVARELGVFPAVVSSDQHAAALADAIPVRAGETVLLPVSELAGSELPSALAARGVVVTRVVAYRTLLGRGGADVPALLRRQEIDAVTFTSPSTVSGFFRRHRSEAGQEPNLAGVRVVCIGRTTLAAAREHGISHADAASPASLEGLVDALFASPVVTIGERPWPST